MTHVRDEEKKDTCLPEKTQKKKFTRKYGDKPSRQVKKKSGCSCRLLLNHVLKDG